MGFSDRWIGWSIECVSIARAAILINGLVTKDVTSRNPGLEVLRLWLSVQGGRAYYSPYVVCWMDEVVFGWRDGILICASIRI
ncbi:hypothetical protein J1N35_006127 [Gossypium stocksii]|uniref:Uncharacterized protein n=1 Tax=Gossypium stocksii TaxID=47602 RepID=A0A9D3WFD3_9ROSI|nr:hypothetical protein J1N35_006127 [Gossypium stocksii]